MRNNGQGIAIDLFLGVAIFLLLLTAVLAIWSNTETTASKELTEKEMQRMTEEALDRLIRSKGEPANWETLDPSDPAIITVGLAKADRVLDENKVASFIGTGTTFGLVGFWKLNSDATDSSGNNGDGIIVGEPVVWKTGTDCKSLGCMQFDGGNDYINAGLVPSLNNATQFTVSAWIKPETIKDAMIVQRASGFYINGRFYFELRSSDGRIMLTVTCNPCYSSCPSGTNVSTSADSASPITTDTWYHVAAVARADEIQVYVNGEGGAPEPCSGGIYKLNSSVTTNPAYMLHMGAWYYCYNHTLCCPVGIPSPCSPSYTRLEKYFNGTMDDVRVYNRALSEAEIGVFAGGKFFNKTKLLIGNYDYYFRLVDPKTRETIKNETGGPVQVGLDPYDNGPAAPYTRKEREKFITTKTARAVTFKYKRWEQNQPIEEEATEHAAIAELVLYKTR